MRPRPRKSRPAARPSSASGDYAIAPSPTAWRKPATASSPSRACRQASGEAREQRTRSNVCTKSSSGGSRRRPCCHRPIRRRCCSGRCSRPVRSIYARWMVDRPSPQNPLINRLTSPPDSLTSKCRRSRHTISNTIRDGTQSVCENTQSVQLGDHRVVGDLAELCREREAAIIFMDDLKSRLANRVQLTSDGHKAYLEAVEGAFGADVDYAQLVKLYGESPDAEKRYSPAVCIGAHKNPIEGNPDPKYISTSFAERQNLNVRMHTRRFTRLTNAFSKKVENHAHSVALFAMYYNFVRIHKTLRTTPAMAAKVTKRLWEIGDIVDVLEAWEAARHN